MSLSMYDASVPVFVSQLKKLDALLDKAVDSGVPESEIMESRIFGDMLPFPKQIQIACDSAKGAMARLTGTENPSMPDTETSLAELKARIAKTIAYVDSFKPDQLADAGDRKVEVKFPGLEMAWAGRDYLRQYAMPNFFFHVSIAYGLLRMKGVKIGKGDFLPVDPSAIVRMG